MPSLPVHFASLNRVREGKVTSYLVLEMNDKLVGRLEIVSALRQLKLASSPYDRRASLPSSYYALSHLTLLEVVPAYNNIMIIIIIIIKSFFFEDDILSVQHLSNIWSSIQSKMLKNPEQL